MKRIMSAAFVSALFSLSALGVEIDTGKSALIWEGSKVTATHYGNVKFQSGKAEVKDGKLVGGEFIVDLDSMSITDLDGDLAKKFIGHMKSSDFFEIDKYPTSKLRIKSVEGNTISADLTIKGKTNPIKFDFAENAGAYVGSFKFDRTRFGIIYNSGNFFLDLGDKLIHNDVVVKFKIFPKK